MNFELSDELIKQLEELTLVNPPEALNLIKTFPEKGLSVTTQNKVQYYMGKALFTMQQYDKVEKICVESLGLAISERDYLTLVKCNVMLGLCYFYMKMEIRFKPCLEIAIEYAIQSGDYELIIYARSFYLNYLRELIEYSKAQEQEVYLVDLIKRVNPSVVTVEAIMKIANLYICMQVWDTTILYLKEALVHAVGLDLPVQQLNIINNLASVYNRIKEFSKSEEILQNGLQVAIERNFPQQIKIMLFNLGNAKLAEFKYKPALEYYDRCMSEGKMEGGFPPMFLIDIYNNYSMCYWFLEDKAQSLKYLDMAIEIANENRLFNDKIHMEVNKTNHLIDAGQLEESRAILNNARKFYQKGKQYPSLLWVNRSLANLYSKMKDYKKCYEVCRKIDEITDEYIDELQGKLAACNNGIVNLNELNLEQIKTEDRRFSGFDAKHEFIGKSKAHHSVLNSALLAAQHQNTSVLITGESGVGKEVIAQFIHKNSIRRDYSFVSVNIAALSASLIESELFGHTKGAFTGADTQTKGFFLQADKGTIFLDEITEMPYELQSKLLRVIETRKVTSVGSSKEISFDSRIISATNQNLRDQMFNNKFRLDLFHRMNTIEIVIPPLRERQEDIEPIFLHFIEYFAMELKKPKPVIDNSLIDMLSGYAFPGNVREMKNIVERMYILSNKLHWNAELLCSINPFITIIGSSANAKQADEEDMILKALIKAKGKQKEAAVLLNMSEATLYRRIVKYNLQKYTKKGS